MKMIESTEVRCEGIRDETRGKEYLFLKDYKLSYSKLIASRQPTPIILMFNFITKEAI